MSSSEPIILMVTDASGADVEHKLPTQYVKCTRCRGKGTHTNPAIDGNGITASEMVEHGEDFREDYFAGVYDVSCEVCKGACVVVVVDEKACAPALLAEYHRQQEEDERASWEVDMDRRAELRGMGY